MIYLICGLVQEAYVFKDAMDLTVLCGAKQRDDLANLVKDDAEALISAGCAGALIPAFKRGRSVVASSVISDDEKLIRSNTKWCATLVASIGIEARPFFSSPTEQCVTPQDKNRISLKYQADVVDTETYAVARLAQERNLPWIAIRAISDEADQTILKDDVKAQNPDGTEDILPVIKDAITRPIEAIREAIGLEEALGTLRRIYRITGPRFLL